MKFTHLFVTLFLIVTSPNIYAILPNDSRKPTQVVKSRETKTHRNKEKHKKLPTTTETKKSISLEEALQEIYTFSNEKLKQAKEKESTIFRTFKNAEEVSESLIAVAQFYESRSAVSRRTL